MSDTNGASDASIEVDISSQAAGDAGGQRTMTSTTQHNAATTVAQNDGAPGQYISTQVRTTRTVKLTRLQQLHLFRTQLETAAVESV
jgi:hypothetical protein